MLLFSKQNNVLLCGASLLLTRCLLLQILDNTLEHESDVGPAGSLLTNASVHQNVLTHLVKLPWLAQYSRVWALNTGGLD